MGEKINIRTAADDKKNPIGWVYRPKILHAVKNLNFFYQVAFHDNFIS